MTVSADHTKQSCCPTCGQPVPGRGFVIDLDQNLAIRNGHSIKLSPQQAEILSVLNEAMPRLVRTDTLICAIYGGGKEPEGAAMVVRAQICQMRKTITQLGVAIVAQWGRGYYLHLSEEVQP